MAGVAPAGRRQPPPLQDLDNGSLEITQSTDDDPLLDAPLLPSQALHSRLRPKFHAIPTVCVANILLLLHVAFVILAFVAGMCCSYSDSSEDVCPGGYTYPLKLQSVIIFAKVVLWILHVFLERYIHFHHSKVRSKGYLLIYRTTRHLKRLPLLIQSTGNAALLLIMSAQHSFPNHNKLYLCFILGILSAELMLSLICLVIYTVESVDPQLKKLQPPSLWIIAMIFRFRIGCSGCGLYLKVSNFNRAKPRPDIIEEEKMYTYPNHITSEIGFRDISSLEEIVEKQGDVIEYLQRHNAVLSKRLLALTSQQGRG